MDIGKLNQQVIIAGLTLLHDYKPTTNQIFNTVHWKAKNLLKGEVQEWKWEN